MAFDGITTRAVVLELQSKLCGGHVKKINQISPKQLTLQIYANGQNHTLLVCADSASARLHLSAQKYDNPLTPPNFCMLCRKHIGQARLIELRQNGLDRTVELVFLTHNELGDEVEKSLVLEMMGKHSNLILLDAKQRVIDAVQRVSHDMSRVRQIYPGKEYALFPSEKREILSEEVPFASLLQQTPAQQSVDKLFYRNVTGFSPTASREICYRAGVDAQLPIERLTSEQRARLETAWTMWVSDIREDRFTPCLYTEGKAEFYPLLLSHKGAPAQTFPSISSAIDRYFYLIQREDRLGQRKRQLAERINEYRTKKLHKLEELQKDYEATLRREELKEEADLLSANVHLLARGAAEIDVLDFFHENAPRRIALDVRKNGWENIEQKYHRYSKLKTAYGLLTQSIPALQEEIAYLNQLLQTLEDVDRLDVFIEIQSEFEKECAPKKGASAKKKVRRETPTKPQAFRSPSGLSILVGRNNQQNDRLTLKLADREDYFFHAKTIPGAHVILRCAHRAPAPEDLEAAAWLAATHSSNRREAYVDIDYTMRKNVYKAKGAKPGMVYYNDYRTMRIATDARPDVLPEEEEL
ncbi:MAG: NFACT RNA binding domain-containing protein [Ndongobacter sp.]|nr:NFACT RNA binding domain-containing protein [Ndongobacter sp.]